MAYQLTPEEKRAARQRASQRFSQEQSIASPAIEKESSGNILTSLIPTATSILGGIGGTILAPGIGTAAGGAAGGAAGKFLQNLIEGKKDASEGVLGEAALGTLGGLGKAFQAGKGALGALRAGEGAAAAGNALRYGRQGAQAVSDLGNASSLSKNALAASNANTKGTLRGAMSDKLDTLSDKAIRSQMSGLSRRNASEATNIGRGMKDIGVYDVQGYTKAADDFMNVVEPVKKSLFGQPLAPVDASKVLGSTRNELSKLTLKPSDKKLVIQAMDNADTALNDLASKRAGGMVQPNKYHSEDLYAVNQQLRETANSMLPAAGYKAASSAEKTAYKYLSDKANQYKELAYSGLGEGGKLSPAIKQDIYQNLVAAGVDNPKLLSKVNKLSTIQDVNNLERTLIGAKEIAEDTLEGSIARGIGTGRSDSLAGMTRDVAMSAGAPKVAGASNAISRMLGRDRPELSTLGQLAKRTATGSLTAQAPSRMIAGAAFGGSAGEQLVDPTTGLPVEVATTDPTASMAGIDSPSSGISPMEGSYDMSSMPQQSVQYSLENLFNDIQAQPEQADTLLKLYELANAAPAGSDLSSAQQKSLMSVSNAESTLGQLASAFEAAGGGAGRVGGTIASLTGKAGLNQEADLYDQLSQGAITQIAKGILGETGVLSDQDIARVRGYIPKLSDSQEVAQQKLSILQQMIQSAKQNALYATDNAVAELQ